MDGTEALTEALTVSEKAETRQSFFSSNFTQENLELPNDDTSFLCEYLDAFIITSRMVLVKSPGKTPGPDGWCADIIFLPSGVIFQKSSNEDFVPPQSV